MPVDIRSVTLTVLAVIAVVYVLKDAQDVMIPIVLSMLISYALDPAVRLVGRLHLSRPMASAVVLLILVATLGGTAYGVRPR